MSDLISRQVLDLWDRYKPTIAVDAIEYDRELKQLLSTNLEEVGTDAISRQAAIRIIKNAKYPKVDIRTNFDLGRNAGLEFASVIVEGLPPIQPEIIYCKDCSKHNVSISKSPYPFKEYICPLIVFRGEAQGHEFDYQFCAYGKRREVTT